MMRDDTENVAELELLHTQRVQLASRLKTPWWYVVAMAFAWAVALAVPIGSRYLTGAGIGGTLLAIVVFCLAQLALARVSGVNLGTRTLQYPSGRVWFIAMLVVLLAADGVETLLLDHGLLAAAIVVGVLATLAGTGCWQGHMRGIRRDLETGRGAM
ncbi:MAG TPA: hypothetical protein VHY58_10675 [Streptosporangiaceae bacterium]|nr:hypothetical protein [Streptosporangiaceae bacterium]